MKWVFPKASRSLIFAAPMSFLKNQDFGSLGIFKKSLSDVFAGPYIFGSLGKNKVSSSRCFCLSTLFYQLRTEQDHT
jgi:hypothetical protein